MIAQLPPLPVEQDAGEANTVLVTDPKNTEQTDSPLDQETAEEDKLHEQVWLKTASRVRLADLARLLIVPIRRFAEINQHHSVNNQTDIKSATISSLKFAKRVRTVQLGSPKKQRKRWMKHE